MENKVMGKALMTEVVMDVIREHVHYQVATLIEGYLSMHNNTYRRELETECKAEGLEVKMSVGSLGGTLPYEGAYVEFVEYLTSEVFMRLAEVPEAK